MIQKKLLVAAGVVATLSVTGITAGAMQDEQPQTTQAKTITTEHKDVQGGTVTVETTVPEATTEPVIAAAPRQAQAQIQAPTLDTTSPLEQFKQDITSTVQPFAAYFVPAYAPDVPTFIENQIRCATRGVDDNTDKATLNGKLSYFTPYTDEFGRYTYRFFDGGCQPRFIPR